MRKCFVLLCLVAGCDTATQSNGGPPPEPAPVNAVAVYRASFGFRDSPNTAYVGGGWLIADGSRAIGGFCPRSNSSSGFVFDYRYTRSGSNTSGDIEVRSCPNARRWAGTTTGQTVDHEFNDFGPFDVFKVGTGEDGRGAVSDTAYLADETENAISLEQAAGSYLSDGYHNGGAIYSGGNEVNVTLGSSGSFALGSCTGAASLLSERKGVIAITLPDCSGKSISGFGRIKGDSLYILMTIANDTGFYIGSLTKQ